MKLTVYSHYGIGDLYESREFVRDWMRLCGVTECDYACRFPAVFADMPEIHPIQFEDKMDMRKGWFREGDHLYVNTWIGCRNGETKPKGDYVIWPGVGCTVEHIYRMHNDYMREAGFAGLPRFVVEYIPTIDYTRLPGLDRIHDFVDFQKGVERVLVCDGPTGSGHAANFSMSEAIGMIPQRGKIQYVFTSQLKNGREDWIGSDIITGRNDLPHSTDVLQISYLSRFCRVIIGRCSGAQMPCETLENWMDSTKTLLSFTNHDNGATFVRNPSALGLKMRRVWSGATTPEEAAKVIESILP